LLSVTILRLVFFPGSVERDGIIRWVEGREFDELDRRIVAALQVNGRASWRHIADVLGEPFRTVTRRGLALLDSGAVRVAGLAALGPTHLIELDCEPGRLEEVAAELSANPDVIFVYALSSPMRLIVEVHARPGQLASLVLDEFPHLDGVVQVSAAPVMEYFRTVADWHPGPITEAEAARLRDVPPPPARPVAAADLDGIDHQIVQLLVADGRVPVAELCAAVGLTAPAVRRRLTGMLERGALSVRAIVDPADIGFPVEAVLWARVAPSDVREVGRLAAEAPGVRYAVMAVGEFQLMVNVTVAGLEELRSFLTESRWTARVQAIRTSLVVRAYKRGGVVMDGRPGATRASSSSAS
jgi:DNA-binding Lrp family transcriptional regulator